MSEIRNFRRVEVVHSELCKEIERAENLPFDLWERGRLNGLKYARDLFLERR